MNNIEMRFVYDCERMEKVLQYRFIIDDYNATNWQTVPTVLGVISGDKVVANGGEK